MKKHTAYLLLVFSLLFFSCNKAQEDFFGSSATSEYSTWPCRFFYDNLMHNDATLASAINSGSRGVFCQVTQESRRGKQYVQFKNNIGISSEKPKDVIDVENKFIMGLNNGIIIGHQTLNMEPFGGFVGYDIQCPNCVRNENNTINPNYRVTMDSKGIATCSKCKKTYDMNNSGIVQNGEEGDTGLARYVAITDGQHVSVYRK